MCKNIFGRNTYVRSKFSCVSSSHGLFVRTQLRGKHCSGLEFVIYIPASESAYIVPISQNYSHCYRFDFIVFSLNNFQEFTHQLIRSLINMQITHSHTNPSALLPIRPLTHPPTYPSAHLQTSRITHLD